MLRPALVLPVVSVLFALAALPARPGSAAQSEGRRLRGGVLLQYMEGLETHLEGATMALRSSERSKALGHVAEMQRLVLLAKLQTPPNLGEQPEAKREAHADAYRKDLAKLLGELAAMEVEILDGELEKASGRVTGSLDSLREEAHDAYQLSD